MVEDSLTWAEQVAAATRHTASRQLGAIAVLYPILKDVGLRETINQLRPSGADIDLGRIGQVLTLNRLIAPQPLYHVGRWVKQTILPDLLEVSVAQLYDQRLGRALEALHPVLGEAWLRIGARAVRQEGIELKVLHYDTTTFYFEGEYEHSDLARYGHSSDKRTDCKRAKVSYTITHLEQLPFVYALRAGNTADVTLPVSNLEAIVSFLKRPDVEQTDIRPLIVSDGKMVTPALVASAHDRNVFYLGPWEADSKMKAILWSVSQTELAAHKLAYRPKRQAEDPGFMPYQAVWRPFTVSCEGQSFTERGLVVWNAGKCRLDVDKRRHHLKVLLNRLREIQGYLNTGKYIHADYVCQQIAFAQRGNPAKALVDVDLSGPDRALRMHFAINQHKLAEAQALDGKYLLVTNHPSLTADQAMTYFKGQDKIEKRNAVLKGPLLVRPIYLKTDRRIEGLVFFTMVALLIWAILERRCQQAGLAYTPQRLLDEFAPLYVTDLVFNDNSRLQQIGDVSDFQQTVLSRLQLPPLDHYLSAESPQG